MRKWKVLENSIPLALNRGTVVRKKRQKKREPSFIFAIYRRGREKGELMRLMRIKLLPS